MGIKFWKKREKKPTNYLERLKIDFVRLLNPIEASNQQFQTIHHGLDAVTEEIITISHRLSGVIDADEVYIIASGKIVQAGSPEKLADEKGWHSIFRQLEDLGWRYDS